MDACCKNVSFVVRQGFVQCSFCPADHHSSSLLHPTLLLQTIRIPSTDASLACSHTKPSFVRTSPPSPPRVTPLVDPSHASVYLHHPILIMQHPHKEHSWNALDDGGDVIRAVVVESFPTQEKGHYLEVVAVVPLFPNFMVITYPRYR